MSPNITAIYTASEPFWNVRESHIHVPHCFRFAQTLLAAYPEVDAEIVLPAILMHDNGYARVPPETIFAGLTDAPVGYDGDITRLHEIAGVEIARGILADLKYDGEKTAHILEIIDGHDSREAAISAEDELVKDADKLWRFCTNGVRISCGWMQMDADDFLNYVESKLDGWFFTEEAKKMAQSLAKTARAELVDV